VAWSSVMHLSLCFGETSYITFHRCLPNVNYFGQMILEKFFSIGQSQTRTAYGGHITCMIGTKYGNFVQDLQYSNNSLCLLVSGEFFFFNYQPIRNKNCPWGTMFFVQSWWNEEISRPSIDGSCKILLYLAKRFQRWFSEIDQPDTRIAYGSHFC